MAKLFSVFEETNQVGVSLDAHLQVLAPHAEAVRAVAARRSLAARRAASRPVIGIVERRKEVATLFFLQQNAVAALVVVFSVVVIVVDVVRGRRRHRRVASARSLGIFSRHRRRWRHQTFPPGSFLAPGVLVDVPGAAWNRRASVASVVGRTPVLGRGAFADIKTLLQPGYGPMLR